MNRQTRTDQLLEQIKPELQKALSTAPSFGVVNLVIHFMGGNVKRIVHKREESIIPGADNEHK